MSDRPSAPSREACALQRETWGLRQKATGMHRQPDGAPSRQNGGQRMAKGYWIGRVDVTDLEAYKNYVAANAEPFKAFGARFLVRGGEFECMEGAARARNVVIEFDSYEQALACYRSEGYLHAKSLRDHASVADIIVIEGYDGPQPGDA